MERLFYGRRSCDRPALFMRACVACEIRKTIHKERASCGFDPNVINDAGSIRLTLYGCIMIGDIIKLVSRPSLNNNLPSLRIQGDLITFFQSGGHAGHIRNRR